MRQAAEIIFHPEKKYCLESRMWQGVPSIECTGGRLWAAWFSGGKYEPSTQNYAVLARSDDGVCWTDPYLVITAEKIAGQRVMDPQLWRDPTGRLWLFWVQDVYAGETEDTDFHTPANALRENFFREMQFWAMYCENPCDDDPVWSEPKYMAQGNAKNNPIVLKNGSWFIPGYDVHSEKIQYMLSEDSGETFAVREGPERIGSVEFDEPMAVERENGDIWLLARTLTGFISESVSKDGGRTWSRPVSSGIPNPATRFYIGRVANGMLLLVNTPSSRLGDRQGLLASLSDDEGKTWKYNLKIDSRRSTTYPDVAIGRDGSFYIIYDCQRDNRQEKDPADPEKSKAEKEICLARISIEDILAGRIVSRDSFLSRVISKVRFDSRALGKPKDRY